MWHTSTTVVQAQQYVHSASLSQSHVSDEGGTEDAARERAVPNKQCPVTYTDGRAVEKQPLSAPPGYHAEALLVANG